MKISIKLDKRVSGMTAKGFPIVVYVTQNYKKKTIRTGHYATKKEWNDGLSIPKSNHKEYYSILHALDTLKERIKKILQQSVKNAVSINDVAGILFKTDNAVFYDAIIDSFEPGYKGTKWSAARSFNRCFPNMPFDEITPQMVQSYIKKLLQSGNRPAGVDSYVRSLRALWNQLTDEKNPFTGHKLAIPDKTNTVATVDDLRILEAADLAYSGEIGSAGRYRDYFLLMFYLGGIDPEVLAKLRYDENVVDGRIVFNRKKGGSNVGCNNLIPPQALAILQKYDCAPYLVPIYKSANYNGFVRNFNTRFKKVCVDLKLSKKLKPKTPRYTFIDRAQQLLVDERITGQVVGHKFKSTTSLYPNAFPFSVQDAAHLKIIGF